MRQLYLAYYYYYYNFYKPIISLNVDRVVCMEKVHRGYAVSKIGRRQLLFLSLFITLHLNIDNLSVSSCITLIWSKMSLIVYVTQPWKSINTQGGNDCDYDYHN